MYFAEFGVNDYFQCWKKFSNQDEFISQIVTNNNSANGSVTNHKECIDSCNLTSTTKTACTSIEILCRYFEREDSTKSVLQKLTEMENYYKIFADHFKTIKNYKKFSEII